MAFRAVHEEWGPVSAHLPDLGCGQDWGSVWRVRPAAPLACDECGHQVYAKVSHRGLRFFQHAPGAPTCTLALESIAHHLLKLELANAARAAGVDAGMEVRGPDGTWRADVMASDPGGAWRVALEAQLAPITAGDITARTERMRADGVPSIWFSDRPRVPWLGTVPSVRLARPDHGEGLVVAGGLMKFARSWFLTLNIAGRDVQGGDWEPVPASLPQFLDWVFTGRIVQYRTRGSDSRMWWTAPHYLRAFGEYWTELERQSARPPRREWTREQIAAAQAAAPLPGRLSRADRPPHTRRGRRVLGRANRAATRGSGGYHPPRQQIRRDRVRGLERRGNQVCRYPPLWR